MCVGVASDERWGSDAMGVGVVAMERVADDEVAGDGASQPVESPSLIPPPPCN
jgi:hypothetical protein